MTFKSLSKAQQRELLREYCRDFENFRAWHKVQSARTPTFDILAQLRLIERHGLRLIRITSAGRELVERWKRDEAARAEHKGRKVMG